MRRLCAGAPACALTLAAAAEVMNVVQPGEGCAPRLSSFVSMIAIRQSSAPPRRLHGLVASRLVAGEHERSWTS
jgi:hypothetical protein